MLGVVMSVLDVAFLVIPVLVKLCGCVPELLILLNYMGIFSTPAVG